TLVQRQYGDRYARLAARIASSGEEIYVAIVSFEEQTRGWLAACAKAKTPERYAIEVTRLQEMLADFADRAILPFDDAAVNEFRRLKAAKVKISTMDLRI